MATFYLNYIDQMMLILCTVFTLINTIPIRKVPAYFVVFGATSIATFMVAGHLFEISYRTIAATFVYDYWLFADSDVNSALVAKRSDTERNRRLAQGS